MRTNNKTAYKKANIEIIDLSNAENFFVASGDGITTLSDVGAGGSGSVGSEHVHRFSMTGPFHVHGVRHEYGGYCKDCKDWFDLEKP